MSRVEQFYGAKDPDRLFKGAPTAASPFPAAGRRKSVKDYDHAKVKAVLENPGDHEMVDFDPRTLHSTQPSIVRAAVQHYSSGAAGTYENSGNAGNARPVVYQRHGTNIILSGHSRATSALLAGEQFKAVPVKGGWGGPR